MGFQTERYVIRIVGTGTPNTYQVSPNNGLSFGETRDVSLTDTLISEGLMLRFTQNNRI